MNPDFSVPEHPSVLVVEDASSTSDMLAMALRFLGFDAHLVPMGTEVIHEVRQRQPDAVLLDLVVPDLDGTEVCGRLRAAGIDTPVIFLSARTAVEDKCHALAAGGDDYVTKPFDLTEVSARIRALVRRARGAVRPAPASSRRLRAAGVELDGDTHEVWRHGTAVQLSATEFALLKLLLENAGQVISKAHILDTVWNYGFQGESGVVETYVYYLRRKLGDSGQSLIRTVRGAGYIVHADPMGM
ncbi:response regulator transcription factor [Streptomyces sp. ME02-8801-2C]|uniref:response regulator transcription factor n=1 Tax=Streptomyces sp. ME02-8801-2C TaxID=3028680 RepID=UPI0029BC152A|nr:response regulator transcription factor [Streptomyces sp. ME02-8801-2C]MDX3453924.1 response regulator transcription factor [Streptomyces sp. ME02-8801-2C]